MPGYTIVGEGRAGGHGVVYQAVDEALGRTVAIKVLRDGAYADATAHARLLAEARAIASLSHPNIVSLFTVAQVGMGIESRPALVLEWVSGGSLAERLDRRPLPGRTAAAMVGALARAVEEAHRSGVLHRDIKPGNILLPGAGFDDPKLGDFGLAKLRGDGGEWAAHSTVIGTPAYMAPELVSGVHQSTGPHADIYALGAVLYELLTGRPPFQAETPFETFVLSRDRNPEPPRSHHPGLSRDLETICLKCLEKMPERRYATAEELGDDLGRFLDGEPVRARPVGPLGRLARWGSRNPTIAALSGTLLVGLAAGLVIVTTLWRIAERHRAEVTSHLEEVERSRGELRDILVAHTPLAKRLLRFGGDRSEAEVALFDRVVALAMRGMEMPGGDLDAQHDAAFATLEVANILQDRGEWGRAEAVCVKAMARLNQLAREHPDRRDFAHHYAQGCIQLSAIDRNAGRLDEEIDHLREATRIGEDLVARFPDKYGLIESLAAFRTSLARAYELRGDLGRAEQGFARASDDLRRLVKEHPEAENGIGYYMNAMRSYAWFLLERRGQFDRYFSSRKEFFETAKGLKLPGLADYTNRRIPDRLRPSRHGSRPGEIGTPRRCGAIRPACPPTEPGNRGRPDF